MVAPSSSTANTMKKVCSGGWWRRGTTCTPLYSKEEEHAIEGNHSWIQGLMMWRLLKLATHPTKLLLEGQLLFRFFNLHFQEEEDKNDQK